MPNDGSSNGVVTSRAHPASSRAAAGAPAPASANAAAAASGAAVAPEGVAGLDMLPRIQNKKDSDKGGASKELASRYSNTCRYCMRRLGHACRVRCDVCPDDFELCVECFATGVEIDDHRKIHPYRVSQNLDFHIFSNDWTAAEELTLLDSMHEKGLSNWDESVKICERNPRSAGQLSDHYYDVYLDRYSSVLPARYLHPLRDGGYEWAEVPASASRGIGGAQPDIPGSPAPPVRGSFLAYAYPPTLAGWGPEGPVLPPASLVPPQEEASTSEIFAAYAAAASAAAVTAAATEAADAAAASGGSAAAASSAAGSSSEAAAVAAGRGGVAGGMEAGSSSVAGVADGTTASTPLHGYMPHRGDFDTEFENDAELLLADMEINPTDHPAERQLKLEVIGIFNRKLDERDKRKQFAKDWGLLNMKKLQAVDRKRTREERETVARLRSVARAQGPRGREEHDKLVEGVLRMRRIVRRLEQLQEYHKKGIRTLAEADLWETERRRRGDDNYSTSEKRRRAENPYSVFGSYRSTSARDRFNRQAGRDGVTSAGGAGASSTAGAAAADGENGGSDVLDAAPLSGGDGVAPMQVNGGEQVSKDTLLAATPAVAAGGGGGAASRVSVAMGPGAEKLTPPEQELCAAVNLLPRHYLILKDAVIREAYLAGHLHKNSARELIQLDVTKSDSVYDFFVTSGWLTSEPGSTPPQLAPAETAPVRGHVPALLVPVVPERTVAI